MRQVCRIKRERVIREVRTTEVAYYVTSLSRIRADAKQLLELSRRHWGVIENGLHYVRDEAFGEDDSTIFRANAPENLATVRNGALNWLRSEGVRNVTATLRSFARNSLRLFAKFGFVN